MNSKVGIAVHKSKALFKAYHRLAENFKFFKGSVPNLQKNNQAHPCSVMWFYPDNTVLKLEVNVALRNTEMPNSPSE